MTPYEMMLSESQERMLIILEVGKEDHARKIFKKWDLDFVVIGKTTNTKKLILKFNKVVQGEIPIDALASKAPVYDRKLVRKKSSSSKVDIKKFGKIKIEDDNYVNHSAEIGRSKNAKDLFDVFDTPVYPELEAGLVLLSDINGTENYNYIRDIRNIHNPNGVWNLRLVGGQKESKINFSAELQGSFLEHMRASLVDVNTRTIYHNIFSEKLLFTPVSNIDRELRLVVGDLEYVNLMTKEILLM